MSSMMVYRTWKMQLQCLTAAVVLVLPALVSGQATSFTQPAVGPIDRQFAQIGTSLTSKADNLLAEADTRAVSGADQKNRGSGRENVTTSSEQILDPVKNSRLAPAVARLELLRPEIDPILRGEGVPPELAAVILVESGGNPAALSSKGARGIWQLMPNTARRYGLQVDDIRDERLDIEKSTHAAAHYLNDLHAQFGSWPLALAAYNTGEQNLQHAIDRSHSTEFVILSSLGLLPLETRNYVPAVMAVMRSLGQRSFPLERESSASVSTAFARSSSEESQ